MSNNDTARPARKRWRWIALGTLGVAGLAGGWYAFRHNGLPHAQAQPVSAPAAAAAPAAAPASDYDRRVVAYLNETEAVTREELGDYLLARRGPEKLDAIVYRRLIDSACKARGIDVTSAEVDAALAESIKGLNVNRDRFIKEYLKNVAHKSLFEWKEDVLRPKLLLSKLCRDRVQVSEEEVRQAFEAQYGEKVQCRVIVWLPSQKEDAEKEYARLRDSEEAFAQRAKNQFTSELASNGGRVKPIGRYTLSNRPVEEAVFKLRPGEVSELIHGDDGITLVKCDGRVAADTSASYEAKHEELLRAVSERKLQREIGAYLQDLKVRAAIVPACTGEAMVQLLRQPGQPGQVLVTINGTLTVTRQDLGEYLIARYGGEALDLMLNRKIIDRACRVRGITVGDDEVTAAYQADLKRFQAKDDKEFAAKILAPYGKSIYEWKEDLLRPKLLMTKLVRGQTKVADADLLQAFEAYYGETVEGRLVMWKNTPEEKRYLLTKYNELRDSEAEFDAAARQQANPALASKAGKLPPFGHHTTGNDNLELEAFKLQPGQVSSLIETPEGLFLFKCDKRNPAQAGVKLEEKRAELTPTVLERKVEAMIPVVFNDLRKQANPRPLIKDASQPEDLAASVQRELAPGR